MKRQLFFILFALACSHLDAQEMIYLNVQSEIVKTKDEAHQFAIINKDKDKNYIVDFFSMDSTLLRTSQYSLFGKTPDKQILFGKTQYKFAHSQQDSLVCFYRDNLRTGAATFYYPDGKRQVECSYKQGLLNSLLVQYYPNDSIKRKDVYEKGVATASTIYSEDGEYLGTSPFYIAPTPIDSDIHTLIRELAQQIKLPIWKKAGVWEAFVEIAFDHKGKMTNVCVPYTNNVDLIAPAIEAATKVFGSKKFEPAIMDNDNVNGNIILPLRYRIEPVNKVKK